jgi:hypothetical protein
MDIITTPDNTQTADQLELAAARKRLEAVEAELAASRSRAATLENTLEMKSEYRAQELADERIAQLQAEHEAKEAHKADSRKPKVPQKPESLKAYSDLSLSDRSKVIDMFGLPFVQSLAVKYSREQRAEQFKRKLNGGH